MLKEFRDFAMKGNVVDLAVGIIIGAAFSSIVTSLVGDPTNTSKLYAAITSPSASTFDPISTSSRSMVRSATPSSRRCVTRSRR